MDFTQKAKDGSFKAVSCKACETKFVSRFNGTTGFSLELRTPKDEVISCPHCQVLCQVKLDILPNSAISTVCTGCGTTFRVVRTATTVMARDLHPTATPKRSSNHDIVLSEELIKSVQNRLPPQPWPSGTHHTIAEQMNLPAKVISKVIQELITRRVVLPQMHGVVYAPVATTTQQTATAEHSTPPNGQSNTG